jgi:hypothetical protein
MIMRAKTITTTEPPANTAIVKLSQSGIPTPPKVAYYTAWRIAGARGKISYPM